MGCQRRLSCKLSWSRISLSEGENVGGAVIPMEVLYSMVSPEPLTMHLFFLPPSTPLPPYLIG